jgi:ATP-dependent Zn protease
MPPDRPAHVADVPHAPDPDRARGTAPPPRASDAGDATDRPAAMGPLELSVYRKSWIGSRHYRRHVRAMTAKREAEAAAKAAHEQAVRAAEESLRAARKPVDRRKIEERLESLAELAKLPDLEDRRRRADIEAPHPGRCAVRLLLAHVFDQRPDVVAMLSSAAPVIVVDVPDPESFSWLLGHWTDVVLPPDAQFAHGKKLDDEVRREDFDAVAYVQLEPIKPRDAHEDEARGLRAVQLALPVFAISPAAETHLPRALRDAASARLTLPRLDAATITRVIRIVTGKPCRDRLPDDVVRQIGVHDLTLAVRFDRTPADCSERLRALAAKKNSKKESRDLTLDELHGLDEAVAWARSMIRDLEDWKRGLIPWSAVNSAAVFNGPPGTAKTTLAALIAHTAGLNLVCASLGKWQGSGDGHLGHLLRAMRQDFEEARAKAPSILFIDEVDSFPVRSSVTHSHRDYVVEVVNAFLEQLDGLAGRQGVIFLAASNDVRRCDPAILRSGRLNRIIEVRLPGLGDLEKIFRVRLRGDLSDADLSELCLLALGSSGADVERIVMDARRFARHEARELTLDDLLAAIQGGVKDHSPESLRLAAVHEAGHILIEVTHDGPEGIHATLRRQRDADGSVVRVGSRLRTGTYEDFTSALHCVLAGRAAEEVVLGAPSQGSGGDDTSDLARATRIAAAMVGSVGHAGPHPLVYLAPANRVDAILAVPYMRAAVHAELAKAYDQAKSILTRHRAALDTVAEHLLVHRRISGHDVRAIIDRCGPAAQAGVSPLDAAPAPATPAPADPPPLDGDVDPPSRDEGDAGSAFPRGWPPADRG